MIKILIVDDQKSVRARLEYLINSVKGFEVVGIAENGIEAISYAASLQPDVILLDMEMPKVSGFTAIKLISAQSPKSKILVLSSHDRPEYVVESMSAGAMGYLLKGASDEEIEQAIRFVLKGHTHMGAGLFAKMLPMVQSKEIDISKPKESIVTTLDKKEILDVTSQNSLAVADSLNNSDITPHPIHDANTGKKQILAWLILTVGLTTGIYGMRQWLRKPLPALSTVEQSATLAQAKFTGKLEPAKTFKIAAINSGVVENIAVQVGDRVEVGQPLLTLTNLAAVDREKQIVQEKQSTTQQQQGVLQQQQTARQRVLELEQKIDRLKYNLSPLRAKIAEANLQVSLAQSEADKLPLRQRQDSVPRTKAIYQRATARYNRLETLHNQGAISEEQLEQAQAEVDLAKVDYDMAIAAGAANTKLERNQRQLSQLQEKLELQQLEDEIALLTKQKQAANLEYQQATDKLALLNQQAQQLNQYQVPELRQVVTATEAGIITELPVAVGDRIYEGNSVVGLAKLEEIKVAVEVNSRIINVLDKQQGATIQIGSGVTAQKFAGKIATVNPIPNEKLNYSVEVEFANTSNSLLVGQLAHVQFLPQIAGE